MRVPPFDRGRGVYLSVPVRLEHHWITKLPGTGLVLLLVPLDLQGGKSASSPPSLPGPLRRRYGLSDDTWTRASRELKSPACFRGLAISVWSVADGIHDFIWEWPQSSNSPRIGTAVP
jgi:hypothetical protein